MVSICTLSARKWDFTELAKVLAMQSYKNIEWVLVDFIYNENRGMVASLSEELSLPIIHIPRAVDSVSLKYMRDIARNRNLAAMAANGDYIIYLDDYSMVGKYFVESHKNLLGLNRISCGKMHFLKDVHAWETPTDGLLYISEDDDRFMHDHRCTALANPSYPMAVLGPEWTYTGNLGMPKKILFDLGGFDPRLSSRGEDSDFGIRAAAFGCEIFYNPAAVSVNLPTLGIPYQLPFQHSHPLHQLNSRDKELITNTVLQEELNVTVEERYGVPTAVCKDCGAEYVLDPAKFIYSKKDRCEVVVPKELSGIGI